MTFDNHARDHRLRMVFPSDVNTQVSHASAQFDVVSHPVQVMPVPAEAWVEDAPTTFPQQDWVDLSDGAARACVSFPRDLPEYEVLDTERREVAITLLRAVGFLGAGTEMQTAVVGAGPNIATPEAQIQRKLTFSLSVLPHQRNLGSGRGLAAGDGIQESAAQLYHRDGQKRAHLTHTAPVQPGAPS